MNFLAIAGLLAAYEGTIAVKESVERHKYWNQARQYADSVSKPLLVVGMKRHFWEPDNGDITADIDPKVQQIAGGVWADERELPFTDKEFGAVYNAHTLEHMGSAEEVEQAVNECLRVADKVFFICPSPYGIYSNLFCPAHKLRLWFDQANNKIKVTDNRYRTGIGPQPGAGDTSHPPPNRISQVLVTDRMPIIVKIGSAYII